MGKIILTDEMRAKFAQANGKQELLDEWGNLLGFFEPAPPKTKFEAWGPFTAEEVEKAFNQKGPGRTRSTNRPARSSSSRSSGSASERPFSEERANEDDR